MASKGIFLVIVLLTKIASIKENTEPEKTVLSALILSQQMVVLCKFEISDKNR
jgi:hypothetical protein